MDIAHSQPLSCPQASPWSSESHVLFDGCCDLGLHQWIQVKSSEVVSTLCGFTWKISAASVSYISMRFHRKQSIFISPFGWVFCSKCWHFIELSSLQNHDGGDGVFFSLSMKNKLNMILGPEMSTLFPLENWRIRGGTIFIVNTSGSYKFHRVQQ